MSKQIVVYQPNAQGKIAKFINGVEVVDGVVVDESPKSGWENVWSFFFSHGATVGGNEWEKKYKRPTDENGREYDGENWVYSKEANGEANPFECTYEAPQDMNGSVPVWDGYNGE
jgi:hypothetical protein